MAILARAGIIARGGDHCDGGEGANVSCDGHPVIEKRQCQSTLTTALSIAQTLQAHYFNTANGQYTGGSLWTDANTLEDLHNLMLATGTDQFATVADQSFIGRSAQDSSPAHWNSILDGSNDDAGWIVLALWKIADYKRARGLDASTYLNSALTVYNIIAGQWDTTCGGGDSHPNLAGKQTVDLTYVPRSEDSGMRGANGLWNDGLTQDGTCRNNEQTTWTYNQGVIASGLSALYAVTKDISLLTEAEITLDATIKLMTTNNILRESCDNAASGGSVCNQDQQIFKGIWTKSVQYYLDRANDPARTAKYSAFLGSQSSGVFHFGKSAAGDIGSVWYAPNAVRFPLFRSGMSI
ncbi:Six-hairpin glycosidase-like protein [Mycena leptocephala]|nr:Six-hairpin glycosidase-like protein [Mycena leptocephala]